MADRMMAMAKDAKSSRPYASSLPLDTAIIEIEWLAPPTEDVLACLLLKLLGEDGIKEIFDE